MNKRLVVFLVVVSIAGLVGFVYWPARLGTFVWDDQICLHTAAWLRHGESWQPFLAANFCDWRNYFRPLIVAMFATELRIFDVTPGPMHLVSLALHLMNVVLVGLLARALCVDEGHSRKSILLVAAATLFYGLHPALIEPVVWISCRADLALTFFVLLGVLANVRIERLALRVPAVAACFFLAACAKETAIVFVPLLVLFDWIAMDSPQIQRGELVQLRTIWRRQWPVYAALLGAGIAYLGLRFGALGFLLHASANAPVPLPTRLQMIAHTLMTYWRVLLWPMTGMAPTHIVEPTRFAPLSATNAGIDLAAMAILAAGIYGTWRRKPLGYAILAVSIALFPVLHIIPVDFDPSLYHERYIMLGLALASSLLPRIASAISIPPNTMRTAAVVGTAVSVLWLGLAIMNIRVTVPLWSNETRLWQWDALQNPESHYAKINLLALHLGNHDRAKAHQIADELLAEQKPCALCMMNVAVLAMEERDLDRARIALDRAQTAMSPATEPRVWEGFVLATARLRELENNVAEATEDYQDAMKMDPLDPKAPTAYASFLARQGNLAEARAVMDKALPLWSPDVREEHRQEFERTLAAAMKSMQAAPAQYQP